MRLTMDDLDVRISFSCKIMTKRKPTVQEEIELKQEESRISYYLDKLADKIEKALKNGEKIDMKFIRETQY